MEAINREEVFSPRERYYQYRLHVQKRLVSILQKRKSTYVGSHMSDLSRNRSMYKQYMDTPGYAEKRQKIQFHNQSIDINDIKYTRINFHDPLKQSDHPGVIYDKTNQQTYFTRAGIDNILTRDAMQKVSFHKHAQTFSYEPRLLHVDDIEHMCASLYDANAEVNMSHAIDLLGLKCFGYHAQGRVERSSYGLYHLDSDSVTHDAYLMITEIGNAIRYPLQYTLRKKKQGFVGRQPKESPLHMSVRLVLDKIDPNEHDT